MIWQLPMSIVNCIQETQFQYTFVFYVNYPFTPRFVGLHASGQRQRTQMHDFTNCVYVCAVILAWMGICIVRCVLSSACSYFERRSVAWAKSACGTSHFLRSLSRGIGRRLGCGADLERHHDIKRPTRIRVYKEESKIYKNYKFSPKYKIWVIQIIHITK